MLRPMPPGRAKTETSGSSDWPLPESFPCIFRFEEILGERDADASARATGEAAGPDVAAEPAPSELVEGLQGGGAEGGEPSPTS